VRAEVEGARERSVRDAAASLTSRRKRSSASPVAAYSTFNATSSVELAIEHAVDGAHAARADQLTHLVARGEQRAGWRTPPGMFSVCETTSSTSRIVPPLARFAA